LVTQISKEGCKDLNRALETLSGLPEMEERKTKSAALVFHRFAGAEFKEVTGFFCW
jgi:hypothetical protein